MYSQGKIYKLYTKEGDECYIGSTIQPLWRRLQVHKYPSNRCRSKELIQMYKFTSILIELLEDYPCNSRYELETREKEYIEMTDNCVNKQNLPHSNEMSPTQSALSPTQSALCSEEEKFINVHCVSKKEKRREFDLGRYNNCPEKARKTKIIQKLSNVGNVPTEASIDKYNITINDLLKLQEYLGKIDNLENKEKINNKLLKRIKYINNKIDIIDLKN